MIYDVITMRDLVDDRLGAIEDIIDPLWEWRGSDEMLTTQPSDQARAVRDDAWHPGWWVLADWWDEDDDND